MKSWSCVQGKGLTDSFGSIAFLGFGSGGRGFFSFRFIFERETLFLDSEIPGVTLLPVPSILHSSLARVLWGLELLLPLVPAEAWGLQGCPVYFPRPQGWSPGGGVESRHGPLL